MEAIEYVVSISKEAAVYMYKSCRWSQFIGIVAFGVALFFLLGLLHLVIFQEQEFDTLLAMGVRTTYVVVSLSFLAGIVGLVFGAMMYRFASSCKRALLAGEDLEIEGAFKQVLQFNIFFGVVTCVFVGVLLLSFFYYLFTVFYSYLGTL